MVLLERLALLGSLFPFGKFVAEPLELERELHTLSCHERIHSTPPRSRARNEHMVWRAAPERDPASRHRLEHQLIFLPARALRGLSIRRRITRASHRHRTPNGVAGAELLEEPARYARRRVLTLQPHPDDRRR